MESAGPEGGRMVDASNINVFKGWLNKTTETTTTFFMD